MIIRELIIKWSEAVTSWNCWMLRVQKIQRSKNFFSQYRLFSRLCTQGAQELWNNDTAAQNLSHLGQVCIVFFQHKSEVSLHRLAGGRSSVSLKALSRRVEHDLTKWPQQTEDKFDETSKNYTGLPAINAVCLNTFHFLPDTGWLIVWHSN